MGNSGSSDGGSGGAWDVQGLASNVSSAKQIVQDGKEIQKTLSGNSSQNEQAPHSSAPPMNEDIPIGVPVQPAASPQPPPNPVLPVQLSEDRHRLARTKSTISSRPKPTAIVKAAAAGDEGLLQAYMDMNMNIHQQDKIGYTALHAACAFGHRAIVKMLIAAGAPVDVEAMDGSTPLFCALAAPTIYMEVVNSLLEAKANVNIGTIEGETPLHLAVKSKSLELVNKLIEKGAKVDVDHAVTLSTPLHIGAVFASLEVIKALVEKGAQVNKQNVYGRTPLILAVENQRGGEIVKFIMSAGADVKYADMDGMTAMHRAILKGNSEAAKILLEDPDSANVQDIHGRTPLHYAANFAMDPEVFRLLIHKNSYVNAVDDKGRTPLHLAAKYENMREVRILLASGAEPNQEDRQGNTPCGLAGGKKSPIYLLLVEQGGSVSDEERMRAHRREVAMKRLKTGAKVGGKFMKCCVMPGCC